ncbi:LysE family translocator [Marinomonas dokdonensis]|uniref:LysE family translocator n=1 Tax=Marinomonas dokdonensis TaxID=328224 RepID=UPI0040559682
MLEILIFAFSIMYSPGPANMLALFAGLNRQGWPAIRYCFGVGSAMLLFFIIISYLGENFISPGLQKTFALIGGLYIAYLAVKIWLASFSNQKTHGKSDKVSYSTGLVLQLCNPKSLIAVVPITTVLFSKAGIEGNAILPWCLLLAAMATGAPGMYLMFGSLLQQACLNPKVMAWINRLMAILLSYVAYGFLFL